MTDLREPNHSIQRMGASRSGYGGTRPELIAGLRCVVPACPLRPRPTPFPLPRAQKLLGGGTTLRTMNPG